MKAEQIRTWTIHLADDISEEEIQAISKTFVESESILNFKFDKNRLIIEYVFPTMTFNDIWRVISRIVSTNKIGAIQKLWYRLMVYMEENERNHHIILGGWQKYVQDIYVTHYQQSCHNQEKRKL